jgi:hypothetical protein
MHAVSSFFIKYVAQLSAATLNRRRQTASVMGEGVKTGFNDGKTSQNFKRETSAGRELRICVFP